MSPNQLPPEVRLPVVDPSKADTLVTAVRADLTVALVVDTSKADLVSPGFGSTEPSKADTLVHDDVRY